LGNVKLGCENEIVLGETFDRVGAELDSNPAVADFEVGVMIFFLRNLGNSVEKGDDFLEVLELVFLPDRPGILT